MSYARIDDGFHDHPKVQEADLAALGAWVLIMSYTRRHLTDGRITRRQVARLHAQRGLLRAVKRLVSCGLLDQVGDDFVLHDYLEWNDSRNDILEARRADRERKRVKRRCRVRPDIQPESHGTSDRRPAASPAQPNKHTASGLGSGLADAAMAALAERPELAPIATEYMARGLAMTAHDHGKTPADIGAALGELAGKVRAGHAVGEDWSTSRLASAADGFVRSYKRRRSGPVAVPNEPTPCRPATAAVSRLRPTGAS